MEKILIVTQYFHPEEFKVNDLAEELVQRGYRVTVLTGKPNYPQGKIFKGYKFWGIQTEEYKGISIIRVPQIPRGKDNRIRLLLNYFSFPLFANLYLTTHRIEADKIICWETSPIFVGWPALKAKRKTKAPLGIWIQDLWPESVVAASSIRNKYVMKWLSRITRRIYEGCNFLFVQSRSFARSICRKGDFQSKIVFVPNWAEALYTETAPSKEKYAALMPKGFIVMFAGNIGEAQDFDHIIDAAALTREHKDIHWVIVGDGRRRAHAQERVQKEGLSQTVTFLGRHPANEMPHFFVHADVMLQSLKDKEIFALTIPAKTQTYMASGKPIVTMTNGAGSRVVEEARCGLTAPSGDAEMLAANVVTLYRMPAAEREQLGQNGLEYYKKHFDKKQVVDNMMQAFRSLEEA